MNPLSQLIQALSRQSPEMQQASRDPAAFAQGLKQSPTINPELLNQLMSSLPMGAGMIAPTTFKLGSSLRAPDSVRAMLNIAADKFPELFRKVMEKPRELISHVLDQAEMPNPNAAGLMEYLNPLLNRMSVSKFDVRDPSIVKHELTHFLNPERLGAMNPPDAATIGLLIRDLLPKSGGMQASIEGRLNQLTKAGGGPSEDIANFMGKKFTALSPEQKATATTLMAPKPSSGTTGFPSQYANFQQEPLVDFLGRAIGDEGFASLAEAAGKSKINPTLEYNTNLYTDLAKALGLPD